MITIPRKIVLGALLAFSVVSLASADQVQMQNGDRYVGKVLSLSSDNLVLQNDVLGTVKLPRSKVSVVTFGAVPAATTNGVRAGLQTNTTAGASGPSNAVPDLAAALRRLGTNNASAAEQDHTKLLEAAGPEAKSKFNELLGGLMSGKLTISDIRAQAKAVADQARALRSDLGDEAGASLDGYLAILDKFLNETSSKTESPPATPAKPARP